MWAKFFLLTAFLNALLKADPEGDITVFRLLLPIAAVMLFVANKQYAIRFGLLITFFFVCQMISQLVSGYPLSYLQFAFTGNYLTMFFMFFFVEHQIRKNEPGFRRFLAAIYAATIAGLLLQWATGYQLPNINDPEGRLNAWYWNENDASLALASFMVLNLRMGVSA